MVTLDKCSKRRKYEHHTKELGIKNGVHSKT